ncbi:GspE/PulE family protein [Chloroflexota bacterium]
MVEMLSRESRVRIPRNLPRPEGLKLIPEEMARKYTVIPLEVVDNTLRVGMANPSDIFAMEALASQSQMRIEPLSIHQTEILEAIDLNYKCYDKIEKQASSISLSSAATKKQIIIDSVANTPMAQTLSLIIEEAVKARATDIHLQPEEDKLRLRFRIDGTLHDMLALPLNIATPLITRVKVLANMNIADQLRPQDGQLSVNAKGRKLDVRVATIVTVHGEMAALRLLDKSRVNMDLSQLGFLPQSQAQYEKMLKFPYGMIVVSGPTGAGKTTTLYASINGLDRNELNIITIEDPVEYRFKNINQIQVNAKAGITFASGLRSILRLDPDVILVGEIRDSETANIAVQSALTGHLVLSSIHANDSTGVIARLLDLGVEPSLISSSLIGVVAQRMVRRICPDCARDIQTPLLEKITYNNEMGEEKTEFNYGEGCELCSDTGYKGRLGIFEILQMSDAVRGLVLNNATPSQLREQAIKDGMVTMMRDGMLKVRANISTPSEILRSVYTTD